MVRIDILDKLDMFVQQNSIIPLKNQSSWTNNK